MAKTITLEPDWNGMRRWVRRVSRTDRALALEIAEAMGREAPQEMRQSAEFSFYVLAHLLRQAKTMPTLDEESSIESISVGPHGSISIGVRDAEEDYMEFIFDPEERRWVVEPQ